MYYTQEQIDRANQADLVSFCKDRASSLPAPEMNTAGSGTTA